MILFVLILLLSAGFVAVGAIGTTSIEERTADNSQQAANALGNHHDAMRSYLQSPRKRKNNKKNNKRNDGVVHPDSSVWNDVPQGNNAPKPGSRRWYQCQRSKGVADWNNVMKFTPQKPKEPGTKLQKRARTQLDLKSPYEYAKILAKNFKRGVLSGRKTVQQVLNDEAEHILKTQTRSIKDPAIRLDFLLHVVNTYGIAYGNVIKDDDERRKLTITLTHVKNMIAYIHNEGILYTGNSDITVSMREYKINKELAITPVIYSMLYRQNSSPFKKMLKKEVEAELDDYIKNHSNSPEAQQQLAEKRLAEWSNLLTEIEKGTANVKHVLETIPEEFHGLVSKFRTTGNLMQNLKANGAEEAATKTALELNALAGEFIAQYTALLQSEEKSRDEHRKTLMAEKSQQAEKDITEKYHSWSIQVTRKVSDKTTEVTLEWHLSHMSEYRERNKKIEKNTHTGARFLMGPSNKVRMPNKVSRHYVQGAKMPSEGTQAYTGDAASLQFLKFGGNSPNQFKIDKKTKIGVAENTIRRRNERKSMLTLINVVLGACPNNESWRLAGLYSDPDLVESDGQMRAKALYSFEKKGRSNQQNKRSTNKNQRKNRNAAKAAAKKNASDEPTLEEVMNDPETVKTLDEMAKPSKRTKPVSLDIPSELINAPTFADLEHLTNAQLKSELKRLGNGKGTSRMAKPELLQRLVETLGGEVSLSRETLTDLAKFTALHGVEESAGKKTTKPTKKTGRKAPDPRRNDKA